MQQGHSCMSCTRAAMSCQPSPSPFPITLLSFPQDQSALPWICHDHGNRTPCISGSSMAEKSSRTPVTSQRRCVLKEAKVPFNLHDKTPRAALNHIQIRLRQVQPACDSHGASFQVPHKCPEQNRGVLQAITDTAIQQLCYD